MISKSKILKSGLAFLLALSVVAVVASTAYADNVGNTNVSLVADDSNISVTVPVDLTAAIGADGTLVYPTTAKFINNSVFPIYVSSIVKADVSPYTVISQTDFATSSANDVLWSTVEPDGGTALDISSASPVDGEWNMAKTGVSGNELTLTFAGAIKNVGTVPTTATQAYTITWTVAAGSK